jgi:DNA polymerase-1
LTPRLVLIDNQSGLNGLVDYLADKDYIAYDVETTGIHKGAEIVGISVCADDNVAYYIILAKWHDNRLFKLDIKLITFLELLETKQLIMHNSVFDCSKTEDNFQVALMRQVHTDTMLLAHTLDENRRIGLKELGKEYFGADAVRESDDIKNSVLANGGEWKAKNKEMYKADPTILGKYGAKDAWLTYKLFFILVEDLYEQGLEKFFYEDEVMPLLRTTTYQLNTVGLKLDQKKLIELQKTLEAENEEAKSFIYKEIQPYIQKQYPGTSKKNTFNIGSSQQLSWLIFGELHLEFNTLTKAGKEACKALGLKTPYTKYQKQAFIDSCRASLGMSYGGKKIKSPWAYIQCDKTTLTKLQHKHKWIERLLKYQKNLKLLSTYIKGMQERVQYGVLYPSFLQTGTTSGRYSSRNPNFQNLPRDDKRVKACIIARPGRSFVGADYSQLEPRVFAFFSEDKRLAKAFDGETDFYSTIGIEVFDKQDATPQKEGSPEAFGVKYKELRQISKVIALATTYGSTAYKLAGLIGKSIDDTQEIINAYLERFPGVQKYMDRYHAKAKEDGVVHNHFGRKRRIPEAKFIKDHYGNLSHGELPYEARNILNLAVNFPIQGTGASIVNRACIALQKTCDQIGIDSKIVMQCHDSIIVECKTEDSETMAQLLQDAMENTSSLGAIKLEAIPKIGTNLSEV